MLTPTTAGNGFDRMVFERSMRPNHEQLLRDAFKHVDSIRWINPADPDFYLDKHHGIDCIFDAVGEFEFTVQAKALNQDFQTVTIEWDTYDHETKQMKRGDWQTCRADYFSYVYCVDGQILRRAIVDKSQLMMAAFQGKLGFSIGHQREDSGARSTFRYAPLKKVVEVALGAVIFADGDWGL